MSLLRALYISRYYRQSGQNADIEHRHDFYQTFLIARPTVKLLSGGKLYSIDPERELVFVRPGVPHALCLPSPEPPRPPYDYNVALDCKFEVTDPVLRARLDTLPLIVGLRCIRELRILSDALIAELLSGEPPSEEPLAALLLSMLTILLRDRDGNPRPQMADLHYVPTREVVIGSVDVAAIKYYIDTHYAEHITLESLSRLACVNKTTLCRAFKSIINMSPIAYVGFRRIEVARELLTSTSKSVGEIASAVGYQNIFHFSRQFHEAQGKSPTEYRRHAFD
ncbi:MAG: AraC family transcriptional regulator [Clostridiaceae bacterium]|nr:AraC family transcriptional regulator [Clostridiaceae bacterium]